jgi:hypothetical protein
MVLLLRRLVALLLAVPLALVALPVLLVALLLAALGFLGQVLVRVLEQALQGLQVLAQVPLRQEE